MIVEGRFLLRTLRAIDREPDFLVLVERQDVAGSRDGGAEISRYLEEERPRERADFVAFGS